MFSIMTVNMVVISQDIVFSTFFVVPIVEAHGLQHENRLTCARLPQLLDGSISLSPLYPSMTNDLHVSIATSLHQSFP